MLDSSIFSKKSRRFFLPYHEFILASPLLFERHSFLVLLEIFSFGGLEVEPRVGKRLDMGQQGLDEGVKLVLKYNKKFYKSMLHKVHSNASSSVHIVFVKKRLRQTHILGVCNSVTRPTF